MMNSHLPENVTGRMDRPIPAILQKIVAAARQRVTELKRSSPAWDRTPGLPASSRRSLANALRQSESAIIAEIKKASPSKGLFREVFDPVALASAYENGGAAALSVVTEPGFFLGQDDWLTGIREVSSLPILRKDFIVDPIQVTQSAVLGADAILLIARILSVDELRQLKRAADQLGLEILFEIHDEDDLAKVAIVEPTMIGINARNLDDFTVDTRRLHALVDKLPSGVIAVAESGLESSTQIAELSARGFRGFLVGETLIRSDDPAGTLCRLQGKS